MTFFPAVLPEGRITKFKFIKANENFLFDSNLFMHSTM